MLVTCLKEKIITVLTQAGRSVGKDVSLPILSHFLIQTEGGRLKVSATNLETGVVSYVPGKVDQEGGITVPARVLLDYLQNLPSERVSLEAKDTTLTVKADHYQTTIKGGNIADFPLIPSVGGDPVVVLKSNDLFTAFEQVAFATAHDESRPEIAGVLLSLTQNTLTVAATDSYRLAEKKTTLKQGFKKDFSLIIPARTITEVARSVAQDTGNTSIYLSENQVKFSFGSSEFLSRLIEGHYPEYQEIIPKEYQSTSTVSARDLTAALKTSGLFSRVEAADVHFEMVPEKNEIVMTAESGDIGKNHVSIPAAIIGTHDTAVFNYRYVLEGVSAIHEDEVRLCTNSDNGPGALLPKTNTQYTYIIMPIKQ